MTEMSDVTDINRLTDITMTLNKKELVPLFEDILSLIPKDQKEEFFTKIKGYINNRQKEKDNRQKENKKQKDIIKKLGFQDNLTLENVTSVIAITVHPDIMKDIQYKIIDIETGHITTTSSNFDEFNNFDAYYDELDKEKDKTIIAQLDALTYNYMLVVKINMNSGTKVITNVLEQLQVMFNSVFVGFNIIANIQQFTWDTNVNDTNVNDTNVSDTNVNVNDTTNDNTETYLYGFYMFNCKSITETIDAKQTYLKTYYN